MAKYVLKRLLMIIPMMLIIIFIVMLATRKFQGNGGERKLSAW